MKKDIEWLKKVIRKNKDFDSKNTYQNESYSLGRTRAYQHTLELIDQLDEPEVEQLERKIKELESFNDELIRDNNQLRNELDSQEVLSHKWISDHIIFNEKEDAEYIYADKLQNLLVPKQEELETKILELIESYKQEEDAYSNPENGWISGFIENLKNLVEKEQKYYVLGKYDTPILFRDYRNRITETSDLSDIYPKANSEDFEFTEQEIKDYDERYWPFAEPVEEAE